MSVCSGDISASSLSPTGGTRRRGFRAAIIPSVSRWFRSYGFADVFDDLIVGAYPLDRDDVDMLARLGIGACST